MDVSKKTTKYLLISTSQYGIFDLNWKDIHNACIDDRF